MDTSGMINAAEYAAEKKAEGALLRRRILLILLYIAFFFGAFLACYITRIIPLFGVAPLFLAVLIFYTWRYASCDVGYTMEAGRITFFVVYAARTKRLRRDRLTLRVGDALLIGHAEDAAVKDALATVKRRYDFSASRRAPDVAIAIFPTEKGNIGVYFDTTEETVKLLRRFSQNCTL